jgi:hypothetical protein
LLSTRRAGKQIYYSLNSTHVSADEIDGSLRLQTGRIRLSLGFADDDD